MLKNKHSITFNLGYINLITFDNIHLITFDNIQFSLHKFDIKTKTFDTKIKHSISKQEHSNLKQKHLITLTQAC